MSIIKKIIRTLSLLVAVMIVVGILGYGLFGVDTMKIGNDIEVIQTNSHTVTLKREISEDMYAIVFIETPMIGRDDPDFVDSYMKYSSTSNYTLYKDGEIVASKEDRDILNVIFELDIYGENIRVVEDVIYYDEKDEEHWFSYRKSTRIAFEGEYANITSKITETKDMTPNFINKIKFADLKFTTWMNKMEENLL